MDAKLNRYYRDGSRATGKWQYGKALAALQSHLRSTSITEDAVIPVLLVCMLFGCFELMEDRSSAAIAHFQFGRGIILDHLRRYGCAGSEASSSPACLRRGTTAQVAVDGPLRSQPGTIPPRLVETFFGMIDHDPIATGRKACQPSPAETQQDGFSLDLRILPALNLIVHRCRHPGIRRRALNILRTSNRREGLSFSQVLCLSGEAYIAIEEGRVPSTLPPTGPNTPPHPTTDDEAPIRFAEILTAGSDATGTDTRYFLDPIVTTPQAPSLPPNSPLWRYAEVLVAGNTGPPPSMTMWCGRFVGEGHVGRGGGGVKDGVEIVEYRGEGWPVRMGRVGSTVYTCA
ncbi:hypothetical protein LTR32_003877 [Rachicladosporium monterosium]|uniref:Uncharacterized protein n=1 Tax=Rachicladosporium monterosium TaxID=1507873 RepID=A0ABR0L6A8_9PEZI|nr:hypothetical protein LTR32_003877 [Rachicladosporium monterosium]